MDEPPDRADLPFGFQPGSGAPPSRPSGGGGDPFADVPLFREIQRVLFSGGGPINHELARQVGIATANWAGDDPTPPEEAARELEETVRAAELAVTDESGLEAVGIPAVSLIRRAQWVEAALESTYELLEPMAARLGALIGEQRPEGGDEANPLGGAILGRMVPLMVGAQVGVVFGTRAQHAWGTFSLPVPRQAGGDGLHFVHANLAAFEKEWSLPLVELRGFAALREVALRLGLTRPGLRAHLVALVRDLAAQTQFDLAGLERQLEGLDMSDPERLQAAFASPGDLLSPIPSQEHRIAAGRVLAFLAVAESHGDHLTKIVGSRMLSTYGRISEALRRSGESEGAEAAGLERLLGVELTADHRRMAAAFCAYVADATDEATLSTMWSAPEAVPTMPEIEEPRLWLARMA